VSAIVDAEQFTAAREAVLAEVTESSRCGFGGRTRQSGEAICVRNARNAKTMDGQAATLAPVGSRRMISRFPSVTSRR